MATKKTNKPVTNVLDEKGIANELKSYSLRAPERDDEGGLITPKYRTGIFYLDLLLKGGFPLGKIIGMGSEEGAGKTTALINAMCNIVLEYPEKRGYYIDVEGGATYELWEAMGYSDLIYDADFNPRGRIHLLESETIQDISRQVKLFAADPNTALIIIDSDTAVVDRNDLEDAELGTAKNPAAKNARMWSGPLRVMNAIIKRSQACLVLVHQATTDLSGFIPQVKSTGGRVSKHMASAELWGRRKAFIGEGNVTEGVKKEEAIGALLELSTTKNRLGLPFRKVILPIFFGKGVSNLWAYKDWLSQNEWSDPDTAEVHGCIVKSGSWYQITLPFVTQKVQGENAVWKLLLDHGEQVKAFVEKESGLFE